MQATLRVRRFDPEVDPPKSYWQDYTVEVEHYFTVLDALIKVRDETDGSLALRCSCRSAVCGSCAMRINGQARLTCKTKVSATASNGKPITVEPLGNLPAVKDLIVDFTPFWDKVRAVQPYLQPQGPEPEEEYIVPNEAIWHLTDVMNCIMCGACVSDCTALEVDSNFLGPAALAKAYRLVEDPRDAAEKERLRSLSEYGGIWDCTRCFECVEVCPKGVDPLGRIQALRQRAIETGFVEPLGARHVLEFEKTVRESSWLK